MHPGSTVGARDRECQRSNKSQASTPRTGVLVLRASRSRFLLTAVTVDARRARARDCGESAERRQWCQQGRQERSAPNLQPLATLGQAPQMVRSILSAISVLLPYAGTIFTSL